MMAVSAISGAGVNQQYAVGSNGSAEKDYQSQIATLERQKQTIQEKINQLNQDQSTDTETKQQELQLYQTQLQTVESQIQQLQQQQLQSQKQTGNSSTSQTQASQAVANRNGTIDLSF